MGAKDIALPAARLQRFHQAAQFGRSSLFRPQVRPALCLFLTRRAGTLLHLGHKGGVHVQPAQCDPARHFDPLQHVCRPPVPSAADCIPWAASFDLAFIILAPSFSENKSFFLGKATNCTTVSYIS